MLVLSVRYPENTWKGTGLCVQSPIQIYGYLFASNPTSFLFSFHLINKLLDTTPDHVRHQFEIAYQIVLQSRESRQLPLKPTTLSCLSPPVLPLSPQLHLAAPVSPALSSILQLMKFLLVTNR